VRQDVDGLVVDVEKATEALADGHERPVAGEDVRIELEVPRHVAPSSQQQDLGRRLLRTRRLGGHPLVVLPPRSVRVGVLVRRARHRRRMARSLVVLERRCATANARCPRSLGEEGSVRPADEAEIVREPSTAATSPLHRRARRWNPRLLRSPAAAVIRTRFGLSDGPVATATASIPSLGRLGGNLIARDLAACRRCS